MVGIGVASAKKQRGQGAILPLAHHKGSWRLAQGVDKISPVGEVCTALRRDGGADLRLGRWHPGGENDDLLPRIC